MWCEMSNSLYKIFRRFVDVLLLLKDGGQSAFSARASPLHWRCPQPIMKVAHWGYRYAALFYQKKGIIFSLWNPKHFQQAVKIFQSIFKIFSLVAETCLITHQREGLSEDVKTWSGRQSGVKNYKILIKAVDTLLQCGLFWFGRTHAGRFQY